jgi:hypothetical protein
MDIRPPTAAKKGKQYTYISTHTYLCIIYIYINNYYVFFFWLLLLYIIIVTIVSVFIIIIDIYAFSENMWKPLKTMPKTNNDWLNKFQRPATNEPMDPRQMESNLVRRLCISSKAASSWIWLWPVTGFFCLWAGQLGIHWWFLGPVMASCRTNKLVSVVKKICFKH